MEGGAGMIGVMLGLIRIDDHAAHRVLHRLGVAMILISVMTVHRRLLHRNR